MRNKMQNKGTKFSILGKFTGECADSQVTNENGLDITREVWETLFDSETYKEALDNGWYIGYLGHPEDINCMDFKDACIVMTEGHIADDGKVYGEFNLVDTPVGRVVKTFIDSGVTFGISVRGAGDIIGHSVDPETFIFRGFDLVTFPAFKNAIPQFEQIAASTSSEDTIKYKKMYKVLASEIPNIENCEALEEIQQGFAENSDIYKQIESRKEELKQNIEDDIEDEEDDDIEDNTSVEEIDDHEAKILGLTNLYLHEKERADKLQKELDNLRSEEIKSAKKISLMTRIVSDQQTLTEKSIKASSDLQNEIKTNANKLKILSSTNAKLKKNLQHEKDKNLQYSVKIEASDSLIAEKDQAIQDLEDKLDKTVIKANKFEKRASDLDDIVRSQTQQILASQKLIEGYQDAYGTLYSQAVGVSLEGVSVNSTTSVEELQKRILGSSNIHEDNVMLQPEEIDLYDEDDDNSLIIA